MKRKAVRRKAPAKKAAARKAAKKVQAIPKGYNVVTPYLAVRGAAGAIEFYVKAFGAKEVMRMPGPGGKLGHAEVKVGDSKVMLSDESEAMNFLGPQARGGSPVHIHLYVQDVDATVAKALALGAKMVREVQDMFYGDRTGSIEDPFGHFWHVSTHKRDVSPAEMKRRAAEMAKAAGG
ncbi:MAG TPA: VOC family protein [Burkholderiales bacterium]|nr:VOC family protein [Burkholderiales bacterium]